MSKEYPEFMDKLPPQALDMEEAVLGTALQEKDALMIIVELLQPKHFYADAHQRIFSAMKQLFEKNLPVDMLSVTRKLKDSRELDAVGGPFYVTQLTNHAHGNTEYHSRIIQQCFMQREFIRIGHEMISEAQGDVFDALDKLAARYNELLGIVNNKRTKDASDCIDEAILDIRKTQLSKDLPGIRTGFKAMDNYFLGWQSPDLIIVAGRPGMGKTALAIESGKRVALAGIPVAIFSLEMSGKQLITRMISSELEIPAEDILRGKVTDVMVRQMEDLKGKFSAKLFIDDTAALKTNDFRAKAHKLKMQHGVRMIIVDYIQLMKSSEKHDSRDQEVGQITGALKGVAKELDIPIIALSQLSRKTEDGSGRDKNKKPKLSDLRESGNIEQDADMVLFIYRPEYYHLYNDEAGNDLRGKAEIIIAKYRNGKPGSLHLRFLDTFVKFDDLEVADENQTEVFTDTDEPGF